MSHTEIAERAMSWARSYNARRGLEEALRALSWSMMLVAALWIVHRAAAPLWALGALAGVGGLGLVGRAVMRWRTRRITPQQAARRVDDHLGTDELLDTALGVERRAGDGGEDYGELVLSRARRALEERTVRIGHIAPVRLEWMPAALGASSLALALVLGLQVPTLLTPDAIAAEDAGAEGADEGAEAPQVADAEDAPMPEEEREQLARDADAIERLGEQTPALSEASLAALERAKAQLRRAAREQASGREALEAMSHARRELEDLEEAAERGEHLDPEKLRELSEDELARELAEASERGDEASAGALAKEMARRMRERLAKQEGGQADEQRMDDALERMAEQMERGRREAGQQAGAGQQGASGEQGQAGQRGAQAGAQSGSAGERGARGAEGAQGTPGAQASAGEVGGNQGREPREKRRLRRRQEPGASEGGAGSNVVMDEELRRLMRLARERDQEGTQRQLERMARQGQSAEGQRDRFAREVRRVRQSTDGARRRQMARMGGRQSAGRQLARRGGQQGAGQQGRQGAGQQGRQGAGQQGAGQQGAGQQGAGQQGAGQGRQGGGQRTGQGGRSGGARTRGGETRGSHAMRARAGKVGAGQGITRRGAASPSAGGGAGGKGDGEATRGEAAGGSEWVSSQWNDGGQSIVRVIEGASHGERSAVDYERVHRSYEGIAESVTEREQLPLTRRGYIRRYFEAIRPE